MKEIIWDGTEATLIEVLAMRTVDKAIAIRVVHKGVLIIPSCGDVYIGDTIQWNDKEKRYKVIRK